MSLPKVSVKHCHMDTKQNLHCLGKNTNVAIFTMSTSVALYCFLNLILLLCGELFNKHSGFIYITLELLLMPRFILRITYVILCPVGSCITEFA